MRRRRFLAALSASALAPVLARVGAISGVARAQAAPGVKRLVIFFSPNGVVPKGYWPAGEGASYTFTPGTALEPLAGLEARLLLLGGVDFKDVSNHEPGMTAMLTGGGADTPSQGQSVDQYIAARLAADTPFASIELGVETDAWGGSAQTRMLYAPGHTFVHPDQDPVSVYKRLFGGQSASPTQLDASLRKKQSVLDLLRSELVELEGRVGKQERKKLDAHLDAVRRMEIGLTGGSSSGCAAPGPVMQLDPNAHGNFDKITRAQTDLMVAALACGLTRVATLQLSHTVGPHVFSWLGISEGHHSLSHSDDSNTDGVAQYLKAERWIAEQFVYLMKQLDALPEPGADGTMLDHTLLVWARELSDGRLHNCESVPFLLTGAKGYLKVGQYLKVASEPHQKLLVSMCQAMGLDNQTFGNESYGKGPLGGLT
jgi:hypothetical protein